VVGADFNEYARDQTIVDNRVSCSIRTRRDTLPLLK
jgi:hypothetical protein